ncbi:MAG: putative acyl-CoA thioester hydrolase [Candidatus Heimdallarchaeota archaeon LC_2]|nr:MAG: putative acyl-CoA thioester hydrolase [Candidatus Heimdallarchaeota archaeon LC_2]
MDHLEEREEKSPRASEIETSLLMMPSHSNPTWKSDGLELGAVNGGAILNLIDNIAGLAALRHCRTRVVTASIDRMDFLNPVHVGELLVLKARVNYVGRTSMEIGVKIETENLATGTRKKTGHAFLTMVAVSETGSSIIAPKLKLETDEDRSRFKDAKERLTYRIEQRRIESSHHHN